MTTSTGVTRNRPLIAVAVLAIAALLSGCGSAASSASAAPKATTLTVVDMAGRTVTIPPHLTRIADVGATPVLNSMIFLFHAEGKLVNSNVKALHSLQAFQALLDPGIAQLPAIQAGPGSVNAESVVALHPQLVITDEKPEIAPLAAAGLTVLYLSWQGPTSLSRAVTMMGQVFADPSQASRYVSYLDNTLATVKSDLKGVNPASYPAILSADPAPLSEPAGSQVHWWAPLVGAHDVAYSLDASGHATYSPEQVLAWNPQFIFTQSPADANGFTTDPRYASVAAVKDRHVTATPGGFLSWGNTTTESPLLLLWLAKQLHPQATPTIHLVNDVRSFYQQFYGRTLTTAQIQRILTDTINRGL